MKKAALLLVFVPLMTVVSCASIKRDMHYSDLAKEHEFAYFFPDSDFLFDFSTLDEAYDFVKTASAKFSQTLSNKNRNKGLGARVYGPNLEMKEPVLVVGWINAQDENDAIDLSNGNIENLLRKSEAAYLFFMVFYEDRIVSLSNYYLDPKYSGFGDGNDQVESFRISGNTYKADYPVGWGIEKVFSYLKGESNNGGSGSNKSNNDSSTATNSSAAKVKTPRPASERNAPTKTDAELVADAIKWGDCAFLYKYTQKQDADKALVTQANNAIKQYTVLSTNTSRYRNNKMEAKIRRVPKELMEQVFKDPETALPGVVNSLVYGITDQFLKAKTLHDWICDNIAYDADMYFSGRITAQDYVSVLKKKKAVCSGYTNLMNEMCRIAGIESIGINGYSKGFGYSGRIGKTTDHAWNAVHIGNKWYLVDVTWDAGYLDRKTDIKKYSTEWLFLDSRPFLYSHLPEEDAYQYYAPLLTADDFMREAYIAGSFFQYGLALKTEDPEYNNLIDGGFTFDIALQNSNVSLSSTVRTPRQQAVNSASWSERKAGTVTFDFDVPDTNDYKGHIFARYNNEVRLQDRIDIGTFEGDWLPRTEAFYNTENPRDRKITEQELRLFKDSYFKVADNGAYYFAEDQFDTARNNAVLKIHKLLELSTNYLDNILDFNIKAAPGYGGFGNGVLKYPYTFSTYNQVFNTQLISPKKGVLKAGETETFVFSSKDYGSLAIILDGKFNFFTKDSKTGNFELTFEIPSGIDTLEISGGRDQRSTHWGLVQYDVVH
ncbi:hypothetical protein AGMMS49991_03230 [Spirochaetia bacterium]|nr:hypothetical protein AGMMS49991_03230 [Spirochaetia bacterium]